ICLFTLPAAHAETAPASATAKPVAPATTAAVVKPAAATPAKPVTAPTATTAAPATPLKPAAPASAKPVAPAAAPAAPVVAAPIPPATPAPLTLEQRHQQELLSNAERIDKANRDLLARTQELQLKNENLDMQLNIIRHDKSSEGIWKGALAVIAGFLMGWFFATGSRRKSSW
ncbi:MAG TPA: hypothetical protein VFM34_11945, partial [Moraxellaceae bacterium]|nr:hypothetical protein [Moraxellaceae bacterium]